MLQGKTLGGGRRDSDPALYAPSDDAQGKPSDDLEAKPAFFI